jgi:two-component system sensor histidine kinase CiaH
MKMLLKRKLAIATTVYWFLLLYIIAALVFWFFSLMHQNQQMSHFKLMQLKADDPAFLSKVSVITDEERKKEFQYIGEGSIFLALILVCAGFLYRSVRRQFKMAQQQQNFMMAITHELKTPIAVAKLNLETLLKHKLDDSKQQKIIQMTLQETNRLNALTNNILISSQLEGEGYHSAKEELNLSLITQNCIDDFRIRFPEVKWQLDIEPELSITGDALLLQILINNLIDNAIKYSSKSATISIILKQANGTINLSVMDEGPGIPDEEKSKIFERFYRIGNESVRKTKGTGLGLYLCKKIAHDHNAYISVTNLSPTGSNFTIHFAT